jgi:threonine dehydrogenase-like Zn-dependent dehydrogenase
MKAVVWHGDEDVRVDKVEDPKLRRPTDAIVRITSTAICGSDLHLYAAKVLGLKEGDILGHEPMGIVEEVGSEVTSVAPGDRVVVPFNIACGACYMCEQGLQSQCETTQNTDTKKGAKLYGYTHLYGGVPGGQAEFLRAEQAQYSLIKIPNGGVSDDRFLYLSDVLPTAWQAVRYADTPSGGTLAVYGLGPIGQMCVRIARHHGVERVIGIDYVPERLRLAAAWGVETLDLNEVDDATQAVIERTAGRGADSVIDAVGMEAEGSTVARVLQFVKLKPDRHTALHDSLRSVRRGGTLSIIGVYIGPDPLWPLGELFDRQIQVRMGQANVKRWAPEILPLLTDGDPARRRAVRDPPRAARAGAGGLRDVPEEGGRRDQGRPQTVTRRRDGRRQA